jgi:hypothetical protein
MQVDACLHIALGRSDSDLCSLALFQAAAAAATAAAATIASLAVYAAFAAQSGPRWGLARSVLVTRAKADVL